MALSQADLQAIQNAQAAYPNLGVPLLGVAGEESASQNNPDTAVSSTGAIGLLQILPSTASNPGYGVTPIDPSTLTDPVVNANFAASYLNGLEQSGDTPAQAVAAYSGGNYSLSDVEANTPRSDLTGQSLKVPSTVSAIGNWIEQLLERGGVIIVGMILLGIGLIFLLLDSKTISVPVKSLTSKVPMIA